MDYKKANKYIIRKLEKQRPYFGYDQIQNDIYVTKPSLSLDDSEKREVGF